MKKQGEMVEFVVDTYVPDHGTCRGRPVGHDLRGIANLDGIVDFFTLATKPHSLEELNKRFCINLKPYQRSRVFNMVVELVNDKNKESYGRIIGFLREVVNVNPGCVILTLFKCEGKPDRELLFGAEDR